MKARRIILAAACILVAGLGAQAIAAPSIICQNVSTTTTVLSANSARSAYSLWTTSGAATIFFAEGSTAVVPPGSGTSSSGPLTGGMSYTSDAGVWKGPVSVVAKTGTVWVCAKESER